MRDLRRVRTNGELLRPPVRQGCPPATPFDRPHEARKEPFRYGEAQAASPCRDSHRAGPKRRPHRPVSESKPARVGLLDIERDRAVGSSTPEHETSEPRMVDVRERMAREQHDVGAQEVGLDGGPDLLVGRCALVLVVGEPETSTAAPSTAGSRFLSSPLPGGVTCRCEPTELVHGPAGSSLSGSPASTVSTVTKAPERVARTIDAPSDKTASSRCGETTTTRPRRRSRGSSSFRTLPRKALCPCGYARRRL